jgi:hypothetical protein
MFRIRSVFDRGRFYASVVALIAFFATMIAPTPTLAVGGVNGSLRGQIVDSKLGSPLSGVTVAVTSPSGSYKDTTDATGRFQFLQLPSDTYIVSFQKQGFEPQTITGVNILGDATVDLGKVSLLKSLSTIVRVSARSAGSAFQPSQTQDSYTVSGQRITQALGNQYSTDETTLLQSVPGVIPTFDVGSTGLSVRGSLGVELGYQFDGVPFTAPFFDANGSQGFLNNLAGGTGGSIQVVSGAGDATQGNSAGGTINTIAPRGSYPGAATLDLEVADPYYNHTLNFNDSFATKSGNISNYFAYSGSRYVPAYAPYGAPASQQETAGANPFGSYYDASRIDHDDVLDNFVFKFGKNNSQSIQILERNADVREYAGYGGLTGLQYFSNPNSSFYSALNFDLPGITSAQATSYLQSLISPIPYQPQGNTPVFQPDETAANPVQFFKAEYSNSLNSSTFFSTTYYNWQITDGGTDYAEYPTVGLGIAYQPTGGSRTGFLADITKTIGDNQTITLEGKYENAKPQFDDYAPIVGLGLLEGGIFNSYSPTSNYPQISDYYLPETVGQPVSATNPCLGSALDLNPSNAAYTQANSLNNEIINGQGGCYLYNTLLAQGKFTGTLPQIPTFGLDYHGTDEQSWGLGLRDQYSPTSRIHLDLGVRVDGEENLFGPDQLAASTPSDVNPDKVGNDFIRPREVEPRAAVSYQLGPNDSIRLSYGRSTSFFFGQTLGTPINLFNLNPIYYDIPAKDSASSPACGSGTHGPGPGYSTDPTNYQNPPANNFGPSYFFKCGSYAQALASLYDQEGDAPDLGGFGPPTYNNFDAAYSHQFSKGFLSGWAAHVTAYERTGFNVEQNTLLLDGPPNPITGQTSATTFTTTANGQERTFGLEGQITTPEIPRGRAGYSAYATFDYINEYTLTPPVEGEASLPIEPAYLFQSGQYFHAGFVPPVTLSAGLTYQLKNGVRITPSLLANSGYAFGVGRTSYGAINGVFYDVPENNYGVGVPYAGPGGPGNAYNASFYVDPQVPGSTLNPNIVASRGNAEPAIAGNGRSPAQAYLNLDLEFPLGKNATVGLDMFNLTNNTYTVPVDNIKYQAVATGVAGPQTGQIATSLPYSASYEYGSGDATKYNGGYLPFTNSAGSGLTFNIYGRFKI